MSQFPAEVFYQVADIFSEEMAKVDEINAAEQDYSVICEALDDAIKSIAARIGAILTAEDPSRNVRQFMRECGFNPDPGDYEF